MSNNDEKTAYYCRLKTVLNNWLGLMKLVKFLLPDMIQVYNIILCVIRRNSENIEHHYLLVTLCLFVIEDGENIIVDLKKYLLIWLIFL